jgi:hypothetical protein
MAKKLALRESDIFKKNAIVETICTEDGIIILNTSRKEEIIYYLDNQVSCAIWNMLNGRNSLKSIKQALFREYRIDKKILQRDLNNFVNGLSLKKLIIIQHK